MQQIALNRLHKLNELVAYATINNDSFLYGRLGLSFYYYHLYKTFEENLYKHKAEQLLGQVFANIHSTKPGLMGAALSTGGAGLGYVVNFMRREGFLDTGWDQQLVELDEYLFNTACDLIEKDNVDLLHGALGVVHYFTEKDAGHITTYLDTLIERICRRAIVEDAGCWFRNDVIKVAGEGVINFSLSHGLCGILLVLISANGKTVHRELILRTVKEGIRFILKHKMDVDFSRNEYSFFPFIVVPGNNEIPVPNGLGWCYGDLNEVLLFYRTGKMFNDEKLVQLANRIGMQSLMRRDEASTSANESSFCHGTAGLAQFFRTLYEETGQPLYKSTYEYWIERTLILLEEELKNGSGAGKEHDYLEGLMGTAFTLLSYISGAKQNWARAFLL